MTPHDQRLFEGIAEIHRLLKEAYDHYFAHSDGYCKSGEGSVWVEWPTYFAMREGATEPTVGVYSYVLGPSRVHEFRNIDDALEAVREWHAAEMVRTYEEHGEGLDQSPDETVPPLI